MTHGTAPPARTPRSVRILLPLLLLAAGALRLVYGDYQPGPQRFYDERFSLQNVHAVLQAGALEPANGYYATLGFLPQTVMLAVAERLGVEIYTTAEAVPQWVRPPRAAQLFTPLAYRMCRWLQCLWGVLSLWLLYRLGKRLFSPQCGLLAALILACSPWHIRASVVFKPDIMLLLTGLLALLAVCHAVANAPRWRPYLAAGVAIAAALSSKLTGGLVALPLVIGTALQARREPRRILLLAIAGLVSLGVFLVLNPQWQMYPRFLERLSEEYEDKAEVYGGTHWQIPLRSAQLLLDSNGFGPLFGALALAGLALLAARLRSLPDLSSEALQRLMVWSYPLLHVALYAVKTPHFKPNNVLPILPVAALLAAWVSLRLWRWAAERLPLRWPVAVLCAVGVGLYLGGSAVHWVYVRVLPGTTDQAFRYLAEAVPQQTPSHVVLLGDVIPDSPWEGWTALRRPPVALFPVADLETLDPGELALADGVLALTRRPVLYLKPSDPLVRIWSRSDPGPDQRTFEPRFLHAWGPVSLVAAHPWQEQGEAEAVALQGPVNDPKAYRRGRISAVAPEERLTVEVWIPGPDQEAGDPLPRLTLNGQPRELIRVRRAGSGQLYSTRRLAIPAGGGVLELLPALQQGSLQGIMVTVRRWLPATPERGKLR